MWPPEILWLDYCKDQISSCRTRETSKNKCKLAYSPKTNVTEMHVRLLQSMLAVHLTVCLHLCKFCLLLASNTSHSHHSPHGLSRHHRHQSIEVIAEITVIKTNTDFTNILNIMAVHDHARLKNKHMALQLHHAVYF